MAKMFAPFCSPLYKWKSANLRFVISGSFYTSMNFAKEFLLAGKKARLISSVMNYSENEDCTTEIKKKNLIADIKRLRRILKSVDIDLKFSPIYEQISFRVSLHTQTYFCNYSPQNLWSLTASRFDHRRDITSKRYEVLLSAYYLS